MVANDVEVEQILVEKTQDGNSPRMTSVVQRRGSIPLSWSHETTKCPVKPDISCRFLMLSLLDILYLVILFMVHLKVPRDTTNYIMGGIKFWYPRYHFFLWNIGTKIQAIILLSPGTFWRSIKLPCLFGTSVILMLSFFWDLSYLCSCFHSKTRWQLQHDSPSFRKP